MTKSCILISHGPYCQALKASTEMIMGPQDSLLTVALLPQEGAAEFEAKFLEASKDLDDFVVFADLLGGTPSNVVSRLIMQGQEIELYAGANMAMVIEFINSCLTGQEADYSQAGQAGVVKVNDLLAAMADEEDE